MKTNPLFSVLIGWVLLLGLANPATAQPKKPAFRVVAIAEKEGGVHAPFVAAAKEWLQKAAAENHFTIDYIETTDPVNDTFLANYQVFLQLNYPPYRWTETAKTAFIKYLETGQGGGWVGLHHASLLGEFDGYAIWPWFSGFMGGIRFKNYIPGFAKATVNVEAKAHPVLKGLPISFEIEKEEWYTYDKNPRPNVRVLATVDESTYVPDSPTKMGGDHPVIWSNERMKARNVYIFMGHHPDLFKNEAYKTLLLNAIRWASDHNADPSSSSHSH
ncbi:ThuA domain-containing protein [Larkinella bovis]|uniref:ThuA domain-containing protein n=1 Tax=Larkinella bovis TaxID=683041 RepID=A0ABW0II22_9BACT